MSDASIDSHGFVLHVAPPRGDSPCVDDLAERLHTLGVAVRDRHDVYAALVTLCRAAPGFYRAIVCCLDIVGAREMEFFTLAARVYPNTPIHVYGASCTDERLARACERGVAGKLTDEVLRSWTAPATTSAGPAPRRSPTKRSTTSQNQDEKPARVASPAPPTVSDKPDDVAPVDEEPNQPVQVPWLRRAGAPKRVRPRVSPPPPNEPSVADTGGSDASSDGLSEPLLTDEELRALFEDEPVGDEGRASAASDL